MSGNRRIEWLETSASALLPPPFARQGPRLEEALSRSSGRDGNYFLIYQQKTIDGDKSWRTKKAYPMITMTPNAAVFAGGTPKTAKPMVADEEQFF
jgi:hypothetical protein